MEDKKPQDQIIQVQPMRVKAGLQPVGQKTKSIPFVPMTLRSVETAFTPEEKQLMNSRSSIELFNAYLYGHKRCFDLVWLENWTDLHSEEERKHLTKILRAQMEWVYNLLRRRASSDPDAARMVGLIEAGAKGV